MSTRLQEFRSIRYFIGISTGAPDEAEKDRQFFASQVRRAAALIDSAIYELELLSETGVAAVEIRKTNASSAEKTSISRARP